MNFKNTFLSLKMGVDLYMGSNYTRINTVCSESHMESSIKVYVDFSLSSHFSKRK